MGASICDRLQYEAAILSSLAARRRKTGNANLHRGVEDRIIGRELAELAKEWIDNPPPSTAANDLNQEKANMSATQPRIWKSNPQRLLEEVREGPLYPDADVRNEKRPDSHGRFLSRRCRLQSRGQNRRVADSATASSGATGGGSPQAESGKRGNARRTEEATQRTRPNLAGRNRGFDAGFRFSGLMEDTWRRVPSATRKCWTR